MGQSEQKIKLLSGIRTNVAEKFVSSSESRYVLNVERGLNNDGDSKDDGNLGVNTPSPANRQLFVQLPEGINTRIESYESKKTNETYVFIHNSNSNHTIYRINGADNSVQIVLTDPLLNFSLDPKYSMHNRVHLFFNHNSFLEQENKIYRKYLTWTEGLNWQGCLDVETAIATNGFRTAYFTTADRTQLWQMAPRPSLKCITGDFIPLDQSDPVQLNAVNLVKERTFEFRIKFAYTDGRISSWGPISEMLLLQLAPCQRDAKGLQRCIKLILDAGGPGVEAIHLAYRNCYGSFTDDQASTFFETFVINKYQECLDSDTPFYNRQIRADLNYNSVNNTFEYIFCDEKRRSPVSTTETDLNYNDIPIRSFVQIPLDDRIAYINNEKGFDPVACESLSKVAFSVTEPIVPYCQVDMVTIKVAVVIHNVFRGLNQPIFIYEDKGIDHNGLKKYFGGLGPNTSFLGISIATPFDDPGPYNQYLGDTDTKTGEIFDAGFKVYVEGADVFATTQQFRFDGNMNAEPTVGNFGSNYIRRRASRSLTDNEYYYIQIATIKVPKGTKGFLRLASHMSKKTDANYRETSTTVMGIMRDLTQYQANSDVNDASVDFYSKEIYFNACNGDVDVTNTPFVVADLSGPTSDITNRHSSTAFAGYYRDTLGRPISNADVQPFGYGGFNIFQINFAFSFNSDCYTSMFTDHNGFYFASMMFVDYLISFVDSGVSFGIENSACQKVNGGQASIGHGDRPNAVITQDVTCQLLNYINDNYYLLKVFLQDTNGVAIPGISVAIQGGKAQTTGADGIATLFIRNRMYGNNIYTRVWIIAIMQSGVCYLTTGDCNACMPTRTLTLESCFAGPRTLNVDGIPAFNAASPQRGRRPGGIYQPMLKFMDAAGRETDAEGDYDLITLPSIQQKQLYSFSLIKWNVSGLMNLPSNITKMAILISPNLNQTDAISWVVDNFTLVDSAGNKVTGAAASHIQLSVKSLFDYQKTYKDGTNVKYLYEKGDRVEFISNGNGVIFTNPAAELIFTIEGYDVDSVNIDLTKQYAQLTIPYTAALSNLIIGAQISLIRPRNSQEPEGYYETCQLIDVVNGEPVIKTGTVGGWDTYFVRRGIKYNEVLNTFTFPFMHHSPSDFWGDHCIPKGRISVKNPYQKKIQYGRKMVISQAWLANGNFNGLGTFNGLEKDFTGEQRGDVTGAVSLEQNIMLIFEQDNALCNSGDDFVRVSGDRLLQATGDSVITDTQRKTRGVYGCQYDDVGSIVVGDGWVFWVDERQKCPVINPWGLAADISAENTGNYWWNKLSYKFEHNASLAPADKMRMVGGYDSVTGEIMLTFFKRYANVVDAYRHSRREFSYPDNETIKISPNDKIFVTMVSYTPEGYGSLPNSITGELFITFRNGQPWFHRENDNPNFNLFYNTGCDQVIEVILNEMPDKNKRPLAMQQQTEIPYYCDRIITSTGQVSEIPPIRVQKFTEGKFDVEFLCDSNSKGGLYNGATLVGSWIKIRLIRENTQNFAIGTTSVEKQIRYNELDSFIFKFMFSEQSAYNAND